MTASASLVFPFQLFDPHPALDRSRPVVLLEENLLFGDPIHPLRVHRRKLVFHRASMRAYAARLEGRGYRVVYLEHDPGLPLGRRLEAARRRHPFRELHCCEPVDDLLQRRLARAAEAQGFALRLHSSPMFLTPRDWADGFFEGRRSYRMAPFYEAQRRRAGILVEQDGRPTGGRWSFDAANRKPFPRNATAPPLPEAEGAPEIGEAVAYVDRRFPDAPGQSRGLLLPVTHEGARRWLGAFLRDRLAGFGTYEDAISRREAVLFHSLLSPLLNAGLLTPQEVVDAALAFAHDHPVPLNSLEGFVRQIIGWREFVREVYQREGVRQRNGNFWDHQRPMPRAFYEGSTGIAPVDEVIRRVLDQAWCHHIERLMVLGNFMLLCGLHPGEVYRWFMELFLDAYDWVMVPNVYGMSQFADGGLLATKPYVSGSNYIRKMSDFPRGPWCETWDALFWTFIDRHRAFFLGNPRLAMMARQLDRMGESRLGEHRRIAARFLDSL